MSKVEDIGREDKFWVTYIQWDGETVKHYGQQFGASWTHICAPKPRVITIHQQHIIKVGNGRLHGEQATTKYTHKYCSKVIKSARKKGGVECFPPHNTIKK